MATDRFGPGVRVTFSEDDGARRKGRVTSVQDKRRWVMTDDHKRISVPVRRLRRAKDEALLLETRLDRSLRARTTDGVFFEEFFRAHDIPCLYERVHTRDELEYFLGWARRKNSNIRWVHYLGHGDEGDEPGNKCQLILTRDAVKFPEDQDVFSGLDGKVLIFSCCCIGGHSNVLRRLRETSGADAIFAYNGPIGMTDSRLGDLSLYELMIHEPWLRPKTIAERVNRVLRALGVPFEGRQSLIRAEPA